MSGGGSVSALRRVSCNAVRRSGRPSARKPCLVRSQNDRWAPAARNRALSVPESDCVSQLMAQTCSVGAQSQLSPFCAQTPWPYCVIFPAIQWACGNAAITSQTSCVLPMLLVCPPTTINRQRGAPFISLAPKPYPHQPQGESYTGGSPFGRVFHRPCTHTHCSGYLRIIPSITFANICVFSKTSLSVSPVRINSTGGSKCSRYFPMDSSQIA